MKTLKERAQALLGKFNACKGAEERKNLGWELAEFIKELANAPEPVPVAKVTGYYAGYLSIETVDGRVLPAGTALYLAPPAPSVPDEIPDAVIDAVADAIGGAYDCLRVWSAWGYGTMGPDDFLPVTDDAERVAEIARAALSSWLSAAPTPAEAPADVARDAELLDWLEQEAKESRTGVSIVYKNQADDEGWIKRGYRLMRYHQIFSAHSNLRAAIDAAMSEKGQS